MEIWSVCTEELVLWYNRTQTKSNTNMVSSVHHCGPDSLNRPHLALNFKKCSDFLNALSKCVPFICLRDVIQGQRKRKLLYIKVWISKDNLTEVKYLQYLCHIVQEADI